MGAGLLPADIDVTGPADLVLTVTDGSSSLVRDGALRAFLLAIVEAVLRV